MTLRVGGGAVSSVVVAAVEDEVGRLSETVDMMGGSVADHGSESLCTSEFPLRVTYVINEHSRFQSGTNV